MQISFDRLFAKNLQFFFAKLVQSVFLCHRLSKKLNFTKIWQVKVGQNKDLVCYRKKHSFRQCASGLRQFVLKPGFRPKGGGLWVCRKSQKISTASYQCFFNLCKKNYRGGQIDPPPPAGIGLKHKSLTSEPCIPIFPVLIFTLCFYPTIRKPFFSFVHFKRKQYKTSVIFLILMNFKNYKNHNKV